MSRRKRLREAGLRLVPRDLDLLTWVYELRQALADDLQALVFGGPTGTPGALHPSIAARRLGVLAHWKCLTRRRLPLVDSLGSTPYVYSLGPTGVPLVAECLGLPVAVVQRRSRLDAKRSWWSFPHEQMVRRLRIGLYRACDREGYAFRWESAEDLARHQRTVVVDDARIPIRPDGAAIITRAGKRARMVLELQRASDPSKFLRKAHGYLADWNSGAYTADTGWQSLRVLTVADTPVRTAHLLRATEREFGVTPLFWFAPLDAVCADPLGDVWQVGGAGAPQALFPRRS